MIESMLLINTFRKLLFVVLYDRPRGLSKEDTAMQRRIDIWIEIYVFKKTLTEISGFNPIYTRKFYDGIVTDITGRLRDVGVIE